MLFGVGDSCRISYSIVSYLYVSGNGSITSIGEESANLSAIVYLIMWFYVRRGFLWDGLCYLMWHSLCLPYN